MPAPKPEKPKREFSWSKLSKTVSFWILIILIPVVLIQITGTRSEAAREIDYNPTFRDELAAGNIDNVTVQGGKVIVGEFRQPITLGNKQAKRFTVNLTGTVSDGLDKEMREKNVRVRNEDAKPSILAWIVNFLPWLLLIGFYLFFFRQMQAGGNKAFSFGKSKAKLLTGDTPKVTFADVAGADEAKQELQEIIEFLRDPQKFTRLGGRLPKGALLVGPPGTGKTLLADAVGRHRGAGLGGGHDEREQTLNQLLVEMDGFESNDGVILIAATNRPDVLDPALLRPGRFDRQIVVDAPDLRGREGILKVHLRNKPIAEDVNVTTLARGTPGMSGADLANLVNEAALLAVRRDHDKIFMMDLEDAKDKVMLGAERKSMVMREEERRLTAYHEGGHAICAVKVAGNDPLHKVTIVPRGRALGLAFTLPEHDRVSVTRQQIEAMLVMSFGGRVAEELVFGRDRVTTGASSDIQKATELARRYVTQWGLSDAIGPIQVGTNEQELFLGRDIQHRQEISQQTAQLVDSEVRRVIQEAYERATQTLTANLALLHSVAAALLERETLTREDVDLLQRGEALPPRTSGAPPTAVAPVTPATFLEPKRGTPPLLGGPEPSPA